MDYTIDKALNRRLAEWRTGLDGGAQIEEADLFDYLYRVAPSAGDYHYWLELLAREGCVRLGIDYY